jgi:hypothetical protein
MREHPASTPPQIFGISNILGIFDARRIQRAIAIRRIAPARSLLVRS